MEAGARENRQAAVELRGPGGEPVDFRRTLASHGVAALPPNRIDEEAWTLETTLAAGPARAADATPGVATVEPAAAAPVLHRMLNLDEDLSAFYAVAAGDAELHWVTRGAGRMLRSPTVFGRRLDDLHAGKTGAAAIERVRPYEPRPAAAERRYDSAKTLRAARAGFGWSVVSLMSSRARSQLLAPTARLTAWNQKACVT
jgi:hypothetical protein